MRRRYAIADVFTDRMFSGNPVAVVLDAEGLTAAGMQAIAVEFNHSETTFVLPPRDPATGSATAALAALLADVRGADALALRVAQGVDMGRPSVLLAQARRQGGALVGFVGGSCVAVMDGTLRPLAGG